jgi:hypothetical protein
MSPENGAPIGVLVMVPGNGQARYKEHNIIINHPELTQFV